MPLSRQQYEAALRKVRLLALDVDGVLTRGDILYLEGEQEAKIFYVRDGSAMYIARLIGLHTVVITGRQSEAVTRRISELPVGNLCQGVLDKVGACREIQEALGIADEEVAYIGDDLLDVPLMEVVGVGIAVGDAHERVRQQADWVTTREGGAGAVREVVDDIVTARELWDEVMADYRRRQGVAAVPEGKAG